MLKRILERDSLYFGVILGLLVPAISFLIFKGVYFLIGKWKNISILQVDDTMFAVAVVLNVFFFRYFMIRKHFEKTGRGMLLVTFVYAGLYVFLFHGLKLKSIF
jgi:membrane protein implicated in regulation of membrane protease activity